MGVTVYHRGDHLYTVTKDAAEKAIAIINSDETNPGGWFSAEPKPRELSEGWGIDIADFDGDHWHDDEANALWLALAPLLDSGSNILLECEGGDYRIYWNGRGQVFEQAVKRIVWRTPGIEIKPEGHADARTPQAEAPKVLDRG